MANCEITDSHDSVWMLEGQHTVFSADLAYNRMHCYLADGFYAEWLANIDRLLRDLPAQVTMRPGHGEACGLEPDSARRPGHEACAIAESELHGRQA